MNGSGSLLHHRLHSTSISLKARCSLFLYFRFQIRTEGHLTVLIHTTLGVIPTEKDHLFADVALTVLSFAFFRMLNDTLVPATTAIETIGIATIRCMEKSIDTSLHRLLTLQLRGRHGFPVGIGRVLIAIVDHAGNRSFHLVLMFRFDVVTLLAQIEVFTLGTMVANFAMLSTSITVVIEFIRGRRVQFVEQRQGRELRST